jgi:hypothetical protein
MTEAMDIGYPLVVLLIAVGLGALGILASQISDRMVRRSARARGALSDAGQSWDQPLRQALEAVRTTPRA